MFNDIIANTNPVLAAMPNVDDLIQMNMYTHPSQGFFNIKRLLHQTNTTHFTQRVNPASECVSDIDQDKLEYGMDYEQLSEFSDEDDK